MSLQRVTGRLVGAKSGRLEEVEEESKIFKESLLKYAEKVCGANNDKQTNKTNFISYQL